MITFQALWDRQAAWSERTFGVDRGPVGPLRHLLRELDEVSRAKPAERVLEWADVLILAIDAARRAGFACEHIFDGLGHPEHVLRQAAEMMQEEALRGEFDRPAYTALINAVFTAAEGETLTYGDLIAAAYVKTLINERREWSAPDADGVVEHVREPEPPDEMPVYREPNPWRDGLPNGGD